MSKIMCFANSKGGVGKSTSAQNVGVTLSHQGYRVLCIDSDPQGHLSIGFGIKTPESLPVTLTNLIEHAIKQGEIDKDMVIKSIIKTDSIDLMPSTFLMDKLDFSLNSIRNKEYVLTDIVEVIKDDYDYILIDCNSSNNIFTINALACADEIIIPCQTQYLSSGAIPLMLSVIKSIKKRINPSIRFKGILLTMYQSTTNQSKSTVESIREEYGDKVFKNIIPLSTRVPDAQKAGKSVIEYDKNNPVSVAYKNFVRELIDNE
ncbi:ParA family protein [Anaerocolumna aminovalerica]|uniref:ParA family protein n=1 Tax=Anaerocolumna aminovalerica TaxID=1527 RepID=UPI001C0EC6D9|nr:ParA family protein [Anaerocolumna aminovalerica]MBU5332141.1 ParA family protein [Anaerocolumna aminovalerica]